jgi:dTDP-glucose 4,6-dehydratase
MKNVLITGGAGFIGSNFVHQILTAQPEVNIINLDLLTYAGNLNNLADLPHPNQHIFIHGNICDGPLVENLFEQYKIDTVVHFAAETHVDRSIKNPGAAIQTNIIGTFTLLECARQAWLNKQLATSQRVHFHHVSTDEVYGSLSPEDPAFRETTPYSPRSPYSSSKASSDHLVRAYHHTYGLPVTITNCSNNYGPFQYPEKLIPLFIFNALQGKPLPVYGDGKQVRDWLYVGDHCEAIRQVILHGRSGETYNIGGNNQPTNLEVIQQICSILDEHFPESANTPHRQLIRYVQDRPGHDRRYAMDIQKINGELGWSPQESLGTGLRKTVAWYLANGDWLTAITANSNYQAWIAQNYAGRERTEK